MGCWGYGIRESDDALDEESDIDKVAGICRGYDEAEQEDSASVLRKKLEWALPALMEHLVPACPDEVTFKEAVRFQVLAAMMLNVGCAFSEEVRAAFIEGVSGCPEYRNIQGLRNVAGGALTEAGLRRNFPEPRRGGYAGMLERLLGREAAITNLVQVLQTYDIAGGTGYEDDSRGLFSVIATSAAVGTLNAIH